MVRTRWRRFEQTFERAHLDADAAVRAASFHRCTFKQCRFEGTAFDLCSFVACTFERCTFDGCTLHEVDFTSSGLSETEFSSCDLTDTRFHACEVTGGGFVQGCRAVRGPDLEGSAFEKFRFSECAFTPEHLDLTTLTEVEFYKSDPVFAERVDFGRGRTWDRVRACVFRECDLSRVNFAGCDLSRCSFRGISADGVRFEDAVLTHAEFADCTIPHVSFSGANLRHAHFLQCDFREGDLSNADFEHATIHGRFDITRTLLDGASFDYAHVEDFDGFAFRPVYDLGRLRGQHLWRTRPAPTTRFVSTENCNHLAFNAFCHEEALRDDLFMRAHGYARWSLRRPVRLAFLAVTPLSWVRFIDHALSLTWRLTLSYLFSVLLFATLLAWQTDSSLWASFRDIALLWEFEDRTELELTAKGFIIGGLLASFVSGLFDHRPSKRAA